MIFDNVLKRTVIKVQSFEEIKNREKYEKRENELKAEIKRLKEELNKPSRLDEINQREYELETQLKEAH